MKMRFLTRILSFILILGEASPSVSVFNYIIDLQNLFNSCEVIFANPLEEDYAPPSIYPSPFQAPSSAGNYIVTITENTKPFSFQRLRDVHKLNHRQCAIAFIFIKSFTESLPHSLFEAITPRYVPILRKDEDYFVFISKNKLDSERILLSPEFGSKIKLKIGVYLNLSRTNFSVQSVSLYENGGKPVIKRLPTTRSTDLQVLFPDTTSNFCGKTLRVANPKAPFYFEMKPIQNTNGNRPVRGLYKQWLDVMMSRYNFTIHLFQSSLSGGTGKQLPNGTWQGAVADVLGGHADMAVYIGHIYNRHKFVEWSTSYTYEWLVFITQKPQVHFDPSAIFRPFPLIIWIGLLLSMILIGICLRLITSFIFSGQPFSYGNTALYLISSSLEQDAEQYLSAISASPVRIMLSFWLLFALIISTAHRAKLVSLLAFPALSWVPSTFDELANSNYRVGVNVLGKGGAAYSVLSTSKNPVYLSLFQRMEIYPDPAVCLRKALTQKIGCIMWKSVADYTEAKNFTDKFGRKPFQASTQTTSFIADGYIFEKKAVFRQNFDRLTWAMVETGLSLFWFQSDLDSEKKKRLEWERSMSTQSIIVDNESSENLKLIHFKGLFYVFVFGKLCAAICFFIETRRLFMSYFRAIYRKSVASSGLIDSDSDNVNELRFI